MNNMYASRKAMAKGKFHHSNRDSNADEYYDESSEVVWDKNDNSTSEEEQSSGNNTFSCSTLFTMIFFLGSLFFLGLLIYAVIKYNTDEVKDACPNLLMFVNVRTVVGLILFASLITMILSNFGLSHLNPSFLFGFFVIYFSIFSIVGGVIISKSMIGNSTCVDILHDDIFRVPLLGILGWVYVACDGLFSIIFIVSFFSACCFSSSSDKNNYDRMDTLEAMPMMNMNEVD